MAGGHLSYTGRIASTSRWLCRCRCGTERVIAACNLRQGLTKSCGCYRREVSAQNATKHGMETSPEYYVWCSMKDRCSNPRNRQYKDYGGRGIDVCQRWQDSFTEFLSDMGLRPTPNPTIERVDNRVGYKPENCVWATRKEQCRNKRGNRMITHNGRTLCVADWAEKLNLSPALIAARLNAGWSPHDALSLLPSRQKGPDGRFVVRRDRSDGYQH